MKAFLLPGLGVCLIFSSFLQAENSFSTLLGLDPSSLLMIQNEVSVTESTQWEKMSLRVTKPFSKRDKKNVLHGHVQEPSLKWDWGFRNGIKYNRVEEEWLVAGTYTHFYSKSYASLEQEGEFTPLWHQVESSQALELGRSSASSWRLDVEIGDLELGKTYQIRKFLSLRPHMGVRAAWMNQKFDIDYEQFERGVLREPAFWNNSLGFGARGGVDSSLSLGNGISFFGDGAMSWLKSYHNIHEIGSDLDRNIGITIMECSLGFQYEKIFLNSLCLLTMKVGYEFNHFFNQKRWVNWFSPISQNTAQEKVSFQGFSTGFRLDF